MLPDLIHASDSTASISDRNEAELKENINMFVCEFQNWCSINVIVSLLIILNKTLFSYKTLTSFCNTLQGQIMLDGLVKL